MKRKCSAFMFDRKYFVSTASAVWFTFGLSLIGFAFDNYELRKIVNSKTFSQVIAINSSLDVIGTREVAEGPFQFTKDFFQNGDDEVEIRIPKEFTNLEAFAISDSGLVVGYISRTFQSDGGSVRAFVWDRRTKEMTLLDPLPSDTVCHAQDISSDGNLITGYSVGSLPPRTRPCVWEWTQESRSWRVQELSTIIPNNPYLQASQVIVSPDGKRIAACITEEQISDIIFNSSLFVWERGEGLEWERRKISDEQLKLKDMNNIGTIVGRLLLDGVKRACYIELTGRLEIMDLLPDKTSSEANGITNTGVIVGMCDNEARETGGPTAFIFRNGVVAQLELPDNTVCSTALGINQDEAICGYMLRDTGEDAAIHAFIRIPHKK